MTLGRRFPVWSLVVGGLLLAGCGPRKFEAAWRVPAEDGAVDWAGVPFQREEGLEVGFANDATHLHVCLYPADTRLQMILMRQGATVWLGDREIGYHITRRSDVEHGPDRAGPASAPPDSVGAGDGTGERNDEDERRNAMMQRARNAPRDLEILSADGSVLDVRSPSPGETTDIRVELADFAYYVLRVPLGNDAVALGAKPGDAVNLIVETPEFEIPDFMARRLASRRPGAGGGGFGSSNRRRRPGVSDLDPPEPLNFKTTVRLAAGP